MGAGGESPGRRALDVLDAVRHARTWHPVPRFYAIVGAIALVPAVAIAAWTRVRWWVAGLGLPATAIGAAFAASLASARGRAWRDVIRHLDPERAWREEIEEELTELRAQADTFRLHAPDGWSGELTLGGASWSLPPRGPRVLEEVGVLADHGDPRTSRSAVPDLDLQDGPQAQRALIAALEQADLARERREAELADRWRDGRVPIEGVSVPARVLTEDGSDVTVALLEHEGKAVMVVAEGIDLDTLRLVRVVDPLPLVAAYETRRRRVFDEVT